MITTAQCQRCKGTFRQMVQNGEHSTSTQVRMTMVQCCLTMVLLEELSFCLHSSLMVVMALSYSLFPSVLLPPLLLSIHLSFFPLSLPSCFLHFPSLYFFPLLHSSCFHPLSSLGPSIALFCYPPSLLLFSFISPSLLASFILCLSRLPLPSMRTGCVPPVSKLSRQKKTGTNPPLPAPCLCSSPPRKCRRHPPTQEDATVLRVLPRGGKNIIVGGGRPGRGD